MASPQDEEGYGRPDGILKLNYVKVWLPLISPWYGRPNILENKTSTLTAPRSLVHKVNDKHGGFNNTDQQNRKGP